MQPDHINGLFETIGAIFLLFNCHRIYKDKEIKGMSIVPCLFFTSWGYWNLLFYPSVGAWWSFYGGIGVAIVNTIWISMILYYRWFKPSSIQKFKEGHQSTTGDVCATTSAQ